MFYWLVNIYAIIFTSISEMMLCVRGKFVVAETPPDFREAAYRFRSA